MKIGRVTSQSVKKGTGKPWEEWIEVLDKSGARSWPHQDIVLFLKKKYKLSLWWQQGVASGYEVHIGRRIEGQNLKGEYTTTATKSVRLNQKVVWRHLMSTKGMAKWLRPLSPLKFKAGAQFEVRGGVFGDVRKCVTGHARFTWQENDWDRATTVQLLVVAKPKGRCLIVLTHEKIKTAAQKSSLSAHWKSCFSEFAEYLNELSS